MENSAQNLACLRELGNLDILLVLDDFSTGYSSLSYLMRVSLDIIKMDKNFITDAPQDNESQAITRTNIGFDHSLGLEVVAKGVEKQTQLDYLSPEGCHCDQGYWFSRLRPPHELEHLLSDEDCFDGMWCPLGGKYLEGAQV